MSSPPLRDGWVAVENGIVAGVGRAESPPPHGVEVRALSGHVILPALVNAHTHLELSWMAGLVPPARSMPEWAMRLMTARRRAGADARGPIVAAVASARACGTGLVGDISNTLASWQPLLESPLSARVFREIFGFGVVEPERIVAGVRGELERLPASPRLCADVTPHAPYSVSPDLFRAIGRAAGRVVSVHAGESPEEIEFLRTGRGAWRRVLEELGAWNVNWMPPACGPVEYLDRLGLVDRRLLAVHGVHLTDTELARLRTADATLVTCPRSNRWTGAGRPPLERLYASGVRIAVGTDSLASVDDLNVFAELAAMRTLAPRVPASRLLESATRIGAEALGFGAELGAIEPGKRAELLAVRIPGDVVDVEEYLVSGIEPDAITWLSPNPEP